jgi:tripeptide aminopeptidase
MPGGMINFERMVGTVLDLVQLDSHSKEEGRVAEYLVRALREAGCEVSVDNAGEAVSGVIGNVIARLPGRRPGISPLLLSSHMDTVTPGHGVRPIREAERIRSDGTTILGGDDKSGLAIILEAVRCLHEHDAIVHGPLEIAFTICEEIGLLGAKHLDVSRLASREALVLDSSHATRLVTRAPYADRYTFRVHGREAHAGICPERGISAVRVAAEAIAAMPLGRIDPETTANLVIEDGPRPTNIIPNLCTIRGEARSLSEERLAETMQNIRNCLAEAAARAVVNLDGEQHRAWIEEICEREYDGYHIPDDAPLVRLLMRAARSRGIPLETVTIGGGSDANVFNRKGLTAVNLGTGQRDVHTLWEWLDLADFRRAAEIVVASVQERAAA